MTSVEEKVAGMRGSTVGHNTYKAVLTNRCLVFINANAISQYLLLFIC
jgi:hypothetical protein